MLKEKINGIIEESKPAMLDLLGKLVAVPSVSEHIAGSEYPYGKPCAEALDIMINAAEEMGFAVRNYEYRAGAADWSAEMGAPERLCKELGVETSSIYRRRDKALRHFTLAYYGIDE